MRRAQAGLIVVALLSLVPGRGHGADGKSAAGGALSTGAALDEWLRAHANARRWGNDDQLGTLHFITPDKRRSAAALVREGVSISLGHPLETEPSADARHPAGHTMTLTGSTPGTTYAADSIMVDFHGLAHTHLDALCHIFDRGKLYNGYDQARVTKQGCEVLAVTNAADGIFTRAVLIDIAALKGVEYLEPGTAIYPADLEAWEKRTGVHVGAGDAVLVRTGRWARRRARGPWNLEQRSAGLHASTAEWLRSRQVAVVGSDVGLDVIPSLVGDEAFPLHRLLINGLGMWVLDNCDLEAVARAAAARKRYDFLLTAAPLVIRGGTGSPINPIATF